MSANWSAILNIKLNWVEKRKSLPYLVYHLSQQSQLSENTKTQLSENEKQLHNLV